MKKALMRSLGLSLALTLNVTMLIGCSKGTSTGSDKNNNTPAPAATQAATTEPLTLPIVKEPITLTYWTDLGKAAGAVKTLNDNLAIQEIQKKTGVKLNYLHPPVGSATEQFNLLVASGQLPDLIEYNWLTVPGGPGSYISNKVIIPLNDPVKKYAPNLLKLFEKYPTLKKEQEMDDGTYYVFPAFYGDRELAVSAGPILRWDMFKKMNMEVPTTIDGWTTMLRAVKNNDKNILPFYFSGKAEFDSTPMFIGAYGITTGFFNNKGKVEYGAVNPKYKDFLQLMNNWYKEGLIDPESLAGTAKIKDAKYSDNKIFAIPGSMGNNITRYTAMMKPKNPDFQMMPIPYPTLNKGETPIVGYSVPSFNNGGVAITTACKYVKEATKLLDYNYSDEGHMLTNWGVEGTTYKMVNGLPQYTDLILNNPEGLSREQAMAKYTIWQSSTAVAKFKDVLNQRDSLPEQIEGRKQWMSCKNEIVLPPITPTADESKEMANVMNEINTYANEMFNNFISGKAPLSDFDKYVSTLKGMGLDRAIQITQQAFDRYSKRP